MGQYYTFVHQNGQQNRKPLPFNFLLSWTKNFENQSEKQQIDIFKYVCQLNNWTEGKIYAHGDYGKMFVFNQKDNTVKEIWDLSDEEEN